MFSIIRKMLARVRSFDAVYNRLDKIEAKLERFEKLADENEALWTFLDEKDEDILRSPQYSGARRDIYAGTPEELAAQISDEMLRTMKTQGDA